jgi:mono/diheme cytochrome c family protein
MRRVATIVFCLSPASLFADATPPIVVGFDRFHRSEAPSVQGGRLLINELGCVSCHASESLKPEQRLAPRLDRVASRLRPDWVAAYLAAPHEAKPGATMPDVISSLPEAERAGAAQDITHYLAVLGEVDSEPPPDRKRIAAGESLFHAIGCVACHGPIARKGGAEAVVVPLSDLAAKYRTNGLSEFLSRPREVRPSGRMPSLGLNREESRSIASFLVRERFADLRPNVAYSYFEGDFDKLPDLSQRTANEQGTSAGFNPEVAARDDAFAIRFEADLPIAKAGEYRFWLASDDGSRLTIDDQVVVDNDGVHARVQKQGQAELTEGVHRVVVDFFEGYNEATLEVSIAGPEMQRQDLANLVRLPGAEPAEEGPSKQDEFALDRSRIQAGKARFSSLGCAKCHSTGDSQVDAGPAAKPLDSLRSDAGCLAESPPDGLPRYGLDKGQRSAIAAALAALPRKAAADSPLTVTRTMETFNCYACHARGGVGGAERPLDAFFTTRQPEMGDEGRVPPTLDGVGAKLTDGWLVKVLNEGAKDRPYMPTRMPGFGKDQVGHLSEAFQALDAVRPIPVPEFEEPPGRVKAAGHFLVGGQAFGCIKCHAFNRIQASGVQSLDMTIMTQRLRRDWFEQYLLDPQGYRPGTRMPASWPDGQAQLKDVLGGSTPKQIESIWRYLEDGSSALEPYGLRGEPIVLTPISEAIIYRNFIAGAGNRAIAVGYPEKVHLAFDANGLRLALLWQGAFIDASRHWTGRGEGAQQPLGGNVLHLPESPVFARLEDPAGPWPSPRPRLSGVNRFLGYSLSDGGRPTFHYRWLDIEVYDRPDAIAGSPDGSLRRALSIDNPASPARFLAATGALIERVEDRVFRIDNAWTLKVALPSVAEIVSRDGRSELRIEVPNGKSSLVLDYQW